MVNGDSFRVLPADKGAGASASSDASVMSPYAPPSRILDLLVEPMTDKQKLEFTWTAPGEDYDYGNLQFY